MHSLVKLLEDLASILALNNEIGDKERDTVLNESADSFAIVVERVGGFIMLRFF